jgi:hypothetical protein
MRVIDCRREGITIGDGTLGASVFRRLRRLIFGAKLDPLSAETRHHIVLIAFLAWVGLGADGLSSACYGPRKRFSRSATTTPWRCSSLRPPR